MDTSWVDRQLFPFESRFLELPGTGQRLHYVDEGEGTTILFVHGTPEWSFGWRDLIRRLRGHYRCIALDQLGFGLSDKPAAADYSCRAHAGRLKVFIEQLGLRDFHLVANDFGLSIGLSYALDHPDNVQKISLFNGWMWPLDGDPHYARPARLMRGGLGRLLYKRVNFPVTVILPAAFGERSKLTPAVHRHYKMALPNAASRTATYAFAREIIDAGPWWAGLWAKRAILAAKPVLLFWGMQDKFVPPYELEKWIAALPAAKIVRFEQAGHFVQEEEPERMAAALERFFG